MSKREDLLREFQQEVEANESDTPNSDEQVNSTETSAPQQSLESEEEDEGYQEGEYEEEYEEDGEEDDEEYQEEYEDDDELDDDDIVEFEEVLEKFGFEGGIVNLDGEDVEYNKLSVEDQNDILRQLLHESTLQNEINEEIELDPSDIFEDETEAEAFAQFKDLQASGDLEKILNGEFSVSGNASEKEFTEMSDYEIFSYNHIAQFSDDDLEAMDEAELTKEVNEAYEQNKDFSSFSKRMETLRNKYQQEEEQYLKAVQAEEESERKEKIEEARNEFINESSAITEIQGVEISDDQRSYIIDAVTNTDDDGNSQFVKDIFKDADSLNKAAFMFYFGEETTDKLLDYTVNRFKEQISKTATKNKPKKSSRISKVNKSKEMGSPQNKSNVKSSSSVSQRKLRSFINKN